MTRPTRILAVDDEPAVREVLRQGLEGAGFAVLEAEDKAEMFRALEDEQIDLITLDLGLGDFGRSRTGPPSSGCAQYPDRHDHRPERADRPGERARARRRRLCLQTVPSGGKVLRIRNVLRRYQREPDGYGNGAAAAGDQAQRYALDSAFWTRANGSSGRPTGRSWI